MWGIVNWTIVIKRNNPQVLGQKKYKFKQNIKNLITKQVFNKVGNPLCLSCYSEKIVNLKKLKEHMDLGNTGPNFISCFLWHFGCDTREILSLCSSFPLLGCAYRIFQILCEIWVWDESPCFRLGYYEYINSQCVTSDLYI